MLDLGVIMNAPKLLQKIIEHVSQELLEGFEVRLQVWNDTSELGLYVFGDCLGDFTQQGLDALLTEAKSWRPMATAPKDGVRIEVLPHGRGVAPTHWRPR